jgi:ABC-type Fe3+/spermidine/putrescine transport system ATPase subunit
MMLFDFFMSRPFKSILTHDFFEKDAMENETRLTRQIEKVSELLAFVVVYDSDNLIELNTWFEEISEIAVSHSQPHMRTMAMAAAKISEELILQGVSEMELDDRPQSEQVKQIQDYIRHRLNEILSEMNVRLSQPVPSNR